MSTTQQGGIPPTKEQMIKVLSENLEVATLQVALQAKSTEIAQLRLKELEALAASAQYKGSTPGNNTEETVQHKLTQDDIDSNEELSKMVTDLGIKSGDTIGIPKEAYEAFLSNSQNYTASKAAKVPTHRKLSVVED